MEPRELIEKAKKQLADLTGFKEPAGIGLKKGKGGWIATLEIVEKKSIPEGMDILGTYEVQLDIKGDLISYEKTAMRKKMDTGAFEKEGEED
ncbi:gas vesicle protein [Patescibacteria group bacterium]|nr:gas vesicle protein [Patescibacteria group bacterium]